MRKPTLTLQKDLIFKMLKYILAAVLFATPAAAANPLCKANEAYARFVMTERQSGTSFLDMIDSFSTSFSKGLSTSMISTLLVIQVSAYRLPIVSNKQEAINEFGTLVYKACESVNT
jgi:hypothetical protein